MHKSTLFYIASFSAFFFIPLGAVFVDQYGFPFSPHVPLFIALMGLLAARAISTKIIPRVDLSIVFYLISIALLIPIAIQSINAVGIIDSYRRQFELLLPYFVLLFGSLSYPRFAVVSLKGYLYGSFASAIYAFFLYFSGEVFFAGRLTVSELYNPTAFGAHLAASILFLIWLKEKREVNFFIFLPILWTLVIALFLSQSRNALAGVVVAGCSYFIIKFLYLLKSIHQDFVLEKNLVARAAKFSFMVVAFLLGVAYFFGGAEIDEKFYSRILATYEGDDAASATGNRSWIWRNYIEANIPILGLGFNNTASLILQAGQEHFPHNAFLLAYVQGGLIFLAQYLIFLGLVVKAGFKNALEGPTTIIMIAFFLIVISFGNDVYQYVYFWVPLGLYLALIREGAV